LLQLISRSYPSGKRTTPFKGVVMIDDIEELKALIVHKMDVLEFLDLIEMDFSELVEILEEQCEEHYTRLHRACL